MSMYLITTAITLLALWGIWPISAQQSVFTEHFSIHANQTGTNYEQHITQRAMYNSTSISISIVNCDGRGKYMVRWMIRYTQCYNYDNQSLPLFFKNAAGAGSALDGETKFWYYNCDVPIMQMCGEPINPLTDESDRKWTVEPPLQGGTTPRTTHQMSHHRVRYDKMENNHKLGRRDPSTDISYKSIYTNNYNRVTKTIRDGHYILVVYIESFTDEDLKIDLEVKLQSVGAFPPKYPNAVIPFYIALCSVNMIQTVMWLTFIIRNYRRTLRIHNLMTSILLISITQTLATFIYQERVNMWAVSSLSPDHFTFFINLLTTTQSVLILFCMTFFSLGDGITKQNLGKCSFACVTIVLGIFGVLGYSFEVYILYHDVDVVYMALATTWLLLGFVLILWIAQNLVRTIRRLHLQGEWAKMFLYITITIGLIVYGLTDIASSVYLLVYLKKTPTCITTAWPILFKQEALLYVTLSAFLCIVMILIRPTASNLRFLHYKLISDETGPNGASHEPLLEEQKHIETVV